jgi:hypothetical protein
MSFQSIGTIPIASRCCTVSEAEILAEYPQLGPRDIQAALVYAAEITRERILPTAVGA